MTVVAGALLAPMALVVGADHVSGRDVALGAAPPAQPPGVPGVRTHQLLLALLGAAQATGRRRAVGRELQLALTHRGLYRNSTEELTPTRGDPIAALPVAVVAATTLAAPRLHRVFTAGAVGAYAMSPDGWARIQAAAATAG